MLLVPLALAPSMMVAASAAERRCGPAVAGWLVAAPVTLAVALLALGPATGPVAESAAAHVPAQVAFALGFAALIRRGAFPGVAAGVAAYAVVAIALPETAGLAIAVPVLALAARLRIAGGPAAPEEANPDSAGPRTGRWGGRRRRAPRVDGAAEPAVPLGAQRGGESDGDWAIETAVPLGARREQERAGGSGRRGELAMRAGVAAVFVSAIYAAMALAGPHVAGAIAAFPAMSGSLALLVHRAAGPQAARHVLRGLVHGLGGYFAFAVTVALVAPSPAAVPAGFVAYAVAGRVAWRAVRGSRGAAVAASAA